MSQAPRPLPGFLPSRITVADRPAQTGKRIRADFGRLLQQSLDRTALSPQGPAEKAEGIRVDQLPETTQADLVRLQGSAESLEALFVKQLLGQMRHTSLGPDTTGPMADFANDLMSQAVADQATKSGSGLGIAKLVFLETAQTLVRASLARNTKDTQAHG